VPPATEPTSTAPPAGAPNTRNPRVDRLLRGMLGASHLERAVLDGASLVLHFRADDAYFVSEEFIARLAVGAAFGLLYRCGLQHVACHFVRQGQDVRLRIARDAFAAFFGLSPEALERLASDPERFEASPVRTISAARQWEFFLQFSKEEG